MKQVLFAVFAHPDDEAFGPSGTLRLAAANGTDVHLLSLTCGDAGTNPDAATDLAAVRRHEAKQAARLIGARSHRCLDYEDGGLSNRHYFSLVNDITAHVTEALGTYKPPVTVEFMSLDPNGLSGHLDHIAASLVTTYAYLKLRQTPPSGVTVGRLRYFCLSDMTHPTANLDWLYMPRGRTGHEIDETIDVSAVFAQKLAIMQAHHSQRQDAEHIIDSFGAALKKEHFLFYKD